MFHEVGEIIHGGVKYSTQGVKYPTEVSNMPRTYRIFHGGIKYSTKGVKHSTEVSNIP